LPVGPSLQLGTRGVGVRVPLLLVVFGERDTTMGLFYVAAQQALSLLRQSMARQRVTG